MAMVVRLRRMVGMNGGRARRERVGTSPEFAGVDASGTIAVTVDGAGGALRVDIDPQWLHTIGPSALGDAVMSAYGRAAYEATCQAPERYTSPEADVPEPPPYGDLFIQRFDDPAAPARAEVERLRRRLAEAARRTEVRGPAGLLTLRLNHGTAVGLDVTDRRRVARASPERLAAEALDLLRFTESDANGDLDGATR
jgi:DNA-binding protein YbaB